MMKSKTCKVLIFDLKSHEETIPAKVHAVYESILRYGQLFPIVVDENTLTILDGHHRLNAFKILYAKDGNYRFIDARLVDYLNDDIMFDVDRPEFEGLTKTDVVRFAKFGRLLPPKTTKHKVKDRITGYYVTLADALWEDE